MCTGTLNPSSQLRSYIDYNTPVVLTIAIELLKQETLLYTKKQQVAGG